MNIDSVRDSFGKDLTSCTTVKVLEELEIQYLGRNGKINDLLQQIKTVPADKKKQFGMDVNKLKNEIVVALQEKRQQLFAKDDESVSIDVTLPGDKYPKGSLHTTTYAIEEISKIFEKIGFIRVSYPEVDWEYFAFEALNMPAGHPARDDFETFFIDVPPHPKYGRMLLTPHATNAQNREMKRLKSTPPIRMINIGKTYRPNWDVTHTPMFHQFDGVCIDKNMNITQLKGTLDYFVKTFFGPKRSARIRPYDFRFTEPSFEVDVSCGVCLGKGCKYCKAGWLELGGAGMIHPNVLKAGGIDPTIYSGFAWGWGVERVFSMKEGLKVDDLRIVYGGDIRFLEQF